MPVAVVVVLALVVDFLLLPGLLIRFDRWLCERGDPASTRPRPPDKNLHRLLEPINETPKCFFVVIAPFALVSLADASAAQSPGSRNRDRG